MLIPLIVAIIGILAAPTNAGEPAKPEEPPTIRITPGTRLTIQAIFSHLSKLTGKPVLPHSGAAMAKTIEFVSDVEATYGVLVAILDVNGFTLEHKIIDGREVIKIFDQRNLRPLRVGPTPIVDEDEEIPDRNFIYTQVVHVKYANPQEIDRALNTRIIDRAGAGSVLAVRGHPILILRDFAPNLKYYRKIIKAMDIPPEDVKLYTVQLIHADASEMANTLTNLIQRRRASMTRGGVQAGGKALLPDAQIVADMRTNKLIIMAIEEKYVEVERIIKELDVELEIKGGLIHVYPLKHQDAQKLGQALQQILSGSVIGTVPGASRGGRARTPARPGAQGAQNVQVRVVAEPETNSLIIEAGRQQYAEIVHIIEQLDIRRPQVLIEAAIIEVSAESKFNAAVELSTIDLASEGFRAAGASLFGLSAPDFEELTKTPALPAEGGGTIWLFKEEILRMPLLLQFFRTNSDVNILSSPRLLTNNNHEGEIKVTDQVPVVTTTDTSTNQTRTTFGGYQEAGITLTITPHINEGNYLRLEVNLTIEDFVGAVSGGSIPPEKNSRSIKGEVNVPNRQMIIIGGLTSTKEDESVSKVPFFGDIPIIGWLFRSRSISKRKKNLYIFITPHILIDDQGLTEISQRFMRDAESKGAKADEISILQKWDLEETHKHKTSHAYKELRETAAGLFGGYFKKVTE